MDKATAVEGPPDLQESESYSDWRTETIRYNDLDTLGHVTSQAFLNYCESARVLFLRSAEQPIDGPEAGWMLVRFEMNFHAQLHFPGSVEVGTRVASLGNSSITTVQGLFRDGHCAATLTCVLVLVDRVNDRPIRIPDRLRTRLLGLSGNRAK